MQWGSNISAPEGDWRAPVAQLSCFKPFCCTTNSNTITKKQHQKHKLIFSDSQVREGVLIAVYLRMSQFLVLMKYSQGVAKYKFHSVKSPFCLEASMSSHKGLCCHCKVYTTCPLTCQTYIAMSSKLLAYLIDIIYS